MIPTVNKSERAFNIFAHGLLGRHVLGRADKRAGLRHACHLERPGNSKIHDGDAPFYVHHDVLRLQVAVNDALAVRCIQGAADLRDDFAGLIRGELALFAKDGLQVASFDEVHGDELDAIGFAKIENANDVFVRDLPGQDQFVLETGENVGPAGEFGTNDFQRDETIDFAISRFVDRAHASFAEELQDFVTIADDAPYLQGAGRR